MEGMIFGLAEAHLFFSDLEVYIIFGLKLSLIHECDVN